MDDHEQTWFDEDAGPVVRFYTMTGGRTKSSAIAFDLVAYVLTVQSAPPAAPRLYPEHRKVLGVCQQPLPVAEIAARVDLPLGVIRVLLGDLLDQRLVVMRQPSRAPGVPDRRVLTQLLKGLREL